MAVKFPYPTSKSTHHMAMRAHTKKLKLWKLAESGAERPKHMNGAITSYTCPSLETYDHDFAVALKKKAAHWFAFRARDRDTPFVRLFFAIYDAMEAESYKDVANAAGVTVKTVQSWASGQRDFTMNLLVLKRLSDASGMSIDEMAIMLFEVRSKTA